ncbi:hypothetical protein GCM10027447_27590 [Glycomyces halotolerans]
MSKQPHLPPKEIRRLGLPVEADLAQPGRVDPNQTMMIRVGGTAGAEPSPSKVAALHESLARLGLDLDPGEVARKELGTATRAALRRLQAAGGLTETGRVTPETANHIKRELEHRYFSETPHRTAKLQQLLASLGHPIDHSERSKRRIGPTTATALQQFRAATGAPGLSWWVDEALVERLRATELNQRLGTRNQFGKAQRKLLRALRVGKIDASLSRTELDARRPGPTTVAALRAFQTKYRLPTTGTFDLATMDKIEAVAASLPAPVKTLKVRSTAIAPLRKHAKLNMTGKPVTAAQEALARLGHTVPKPEHDAAAFGKGTRKAVLAYQAAKRLTPTGHVDGPTRKALNADLLALVPERERPRPRRRVRGAVRDDHWKPLTGVKVRLSHRTATGKEGDLIAERVTGGKGFYDLPYDPPRDPRTGAARPLHLMLTFTGADGTALGTQTLFDPKPIQWANLTLGDLPYRGPSAYERLREAVDTALAGTALTDLVESGDRQEVTVTALAAGATQEQVMRLILAERAAAADDQAALTPALYYAYLVQSLPPGLPDGLLAATAEWTRIDELTEQVRKGIGLLDADQRARAFDAAADAGVLPIGEIRARDTALDALGTHAVAAALTTPGLIGPAPLQTVLDASNIAPEHYEAIASALIDHGAPTPEYWERLREEAEGIGLLDDWRDLVVTADLAGLTSGHRPTLAAVKQRLDDPASELGAPRDLAKLSADQWAELIGDAGVAVPDGTSGDDESVAAHAATLAESAAQRFPTAALTAELARADGAGLAHVDRAARFLDDHPDLELKHTGIDAYLADRELEIERDLLVELRVQQRVLRLSPNPKTAIALLKAGLHYSAPIASLDRTELARRLAPHGLDDGEIATVYNRAQLSYASVLSKLVQLRADLVPDQFDVFETQTLTLERVKAAIGDVPDLELLFGALDYCECRHCESVYGPAAYFTDLLRFLSSRSARPDGDDTVLDVLLARRGDLDDIKLDCANTETPLPYIDLVCEILERAVPTASPAPAAPQTTRGAAELRAVPEHLHAPAYDVVKESAFPVSGAYNAWQAEARLLLDHLGVPRGELMRMFQDPLDETAAASAAGEHFGLSTKDMQFIAAAETDPAALDAIWGLDTTAAGVGVLAFLRHSRIEYTELLQLLELDWIRDAAPELALDRPEGTCRLDEQSVTGLTPAAWDRIHRFLRLRPHTPWQPWQLDRLLLAPSLGAGALDGRTVKALADFDRLTATLRLDFDQAIALYAPLSTATAPGAARSAYAARFTDPNLVDPPDPAFEPPLPGTEPMADHRPTLAAAWQVTEDELALLLEHADGPITVENLTAPLRHVLLARSLGTSIRDLLTLIDLADTADPFESPAATVALTDLHHDIGASGLDIAELDWLLRHRPDSPLEPRTETVAGHLEALRESLRTAPEGERRGQLAAALAAAFELEDAHTVALLDGLRPDGALWTVFLDDDLTAQDAAGDYASALTEANFGPLFTAWRRLHKAAAVLRRTPVDATELTWLLDRAPTHGLLHLGDLPAAPGEADAGLGAWRALASWTALYSRYPRPDESGWPEVFDAAADAAPVPEIRDLVAALTGWDVGDLAVLDGDDAAPYGSAAWLRRTETVMGALRRLGVGADEARRWADRDDDTDGAQRKTAELVRQTVKSKYDPAVWLDLMPDLTDRLREARRDALVAYLVEHSMRTTSPTIAHGGEDHANPAHWTDENDLQRYFLVDTQMAACRLTSRIKQATGSVQMFAQRCLLNLESPLVRISKSEMEDTASLDSWSQWKTMMHSYRIWEAARKVFLYPENWIEPELRENKTQFFREFEDDLASADITGANCETAYRAYLQKLNDASNLETLGVCHEVSGGASGGLPAVNRLHVVARNPSAGAGLYYRTFDLNYAEWTGWETVELDVASPQVVPVVYRGRLYLFWLEITERAEQPRRQPAAKATDGATEPAAPQVTLEIALHWSERTPDGWTSGRTGPDKLIHPWHRPASAYTLKPREFRGRLWMDLYVASTPEFNDGKFYNEFTENYRRFAADTFSNTNATWHSSSFVFNGADVVELRLKGSHARYRDKSTGVMSYDNSYDFVHRDFAEEGRKIKRLTGRLDASPLRQPVGMHFASGRLANNVDPANPDRAAVAVGPGDTRPLLNDAPDPFELVLAPNGDQYNDREEPFSPLIYQDPDRRYFVRRASRASMLFLSGIGAVPFSFETHRWYPFTHPYAARFLETLDSSGLDRLLARSTQSIAPDGDTDFSYDPAPLNIVDPTARGGVDFTRSGAYSIYNWEVFFHLPMLIASKLGTEQRHEEAMSWFHRVFDPTSTDGADAPQRYWVTRPFFEHSGDGYRAQRIESILADIGDHLDELRAWKHHPFSPHVIARHRPIAYQKAVVMRYLDNLIAWADMEFRRDSMESTNRALLLYTLAAELLGRRPEKVPAPERESRTYAELADEAGLDPFGNASVPAVLENLGPAPDLAAPDVPEEPLPQFPVPYFGIPVNDRLLGYWDTLADRLFKLRNCMNIEGVTRRLPLFEPPIDPGLLVKAAAQGADLNSIMSVVAAPSAQYRFRYLVARAADLCAELRALGEKLLSVLERRDAEALARLRAAQETSLNETILDIREQQIQEAGEARAALESGRSALGERISHYDSFPRMLVSEEIGVVARGAGLVGSLIASMLQFKAGVASMLPTMSVGFAGFGGSPSFSLSFGGSNLSGLLSNSASGISTLSGIANSIATMAEMQGRYTRDFRTNQFQKTLAEKELERLEAEITTALTREAIAEAERDRQRNQVEDAAAVEEFLKSKYTDAELYDWMVKQVSVIYFQAYKIAFDAARQAEAIFRFELADPDAMYVQFGYWDSLRKGLLAPERLTNDLRRMESDYLVRHGRGLEITKHVSLAQIDPLALLKLKLTGGVEIELPEWLFDLDHPGHYRRRLKSAAISIPCVAGPYTSVNCTVSMTANGVRLTDSVTGGYGDPLASGGDTRFWTSPVPTSTIVTSHGVNDRGMFELRLEGDRFLPFEGAGVASRWSIELPPENNQFDLASVTDVVLHLDYTAQVGSPELADLARANLDTVLPNAGAVLFVLEEQFGTAWHRMLHPADGEDQELVFDLDAAHLPFWARARMGSGALSVTGADLVVDTPHEEGFTTRWQLPGETAPSAEVPGARDPGLDQAPHAAIAPTAPRPPMLGEWRVRMRRDSAADYTSLNADDVRRAYLMVRFEIA